jgi:hypothetical protein
MKNVDQTELVPELITWKEHNGEDFDLEAWISCVGDFEHAIGYLEVFWPNFYEMHGCIFVGSIPDEENYQSWVGGTDGDKSKIESVLNHVHIMDLFQVGGSLSPTKKQIIYLGNKIKEMWYVKCSAQFPGRSICVDFYTGDDNDLLEYQVTLYQTHHEKS